MYDCGSCYGKRMNKYGAKKNAIAKDGNKRDSKYEASVADELLLRKELVILKTMRASIK
jgi:hypothetical protein